MSKFNVATCATPKEKREEMTLIPELWAGKFFGYTLVEIKQFIDFGKSRDFEPTRSLIG